MLKPLLFFSLLTFGGIASAATPNILFVFIDDIGWGDLSCYGRSTLDKLGNPITPNLDRIASEGIRFTQGYVAAPICSPSRTGVLTGAYPCQHGIYSFIDNHAANLSRRMNDWLQPEATTTARLFRDHGYVTGQFGKWHMGNGRDVNNAPVPGAYGFQKSLVAFEGNGDRFLYLNDDGSKDGLSQANEDATVGTYEYVHWYEAASRDTDSALAYITTAVQAGKPFYIHLPFNDTHSPYNVAPGHDNDFDHITSNTNGKLFLGELHNLDAQIGRLVDAIDALGIGGNTLISIIGDNGAPNDALNSLLNRNGGLRGGKGGIWEGGIREPFIVRMPGTVPAGVVNTTTAVSTLDLLPTFCSFGNVPLPSAPLAGENMKDVFLGSTRARGKPLFWEFGTAGGISMEGPKLAVRVRDMKFMRDPDGGNRELYNLSVDKEEANNLVNSPAQAATVAMMEPMVMKWYQETVLGEVGETYVSHDGTPPATIIADSYNLPSGNSTGTGLATGTGVNENLPNRLTGTLAGTLKYLRTDTAKAGSAHSITANRLNITAAVNTTAFQFSADGVNAHDFGPEIAGRRYEWRVTMDLDDPDQTKARMTLGIADVAKPASGVGDHDLGVQLDLVPGNTISVFKRIDDASDSGTGDVNTSIATGLPAGLPVEVRVVMQDSTDYTGFNTRYEIFINGVSANTGYLTFSNSSRYLIFDTSSNIGPVSYDNFALETLDAGTDKIARTPILGISEATPSAVAGLEKIRLYWTTQPGQTVEPVISNDLQTWTPFLDEENVPIHVATGFGTIRWLEVAIPQQYQNRGFIRLRTID